MSRNSADCDSVPRVPKAAPGALDARVARTRRKLRRAALELAAAGQIEDVSVVELARAAGINRATFYKHADSPLQVLKEALVEDLDALRESFLSESEDTATDLAELWRLTTAATAEHLTRFERVYQQGLATDADSSLLALLSEHIAYSMRQLLAARPELLPKHSRREAEFVSSAYAAYLGHGLAGLMRVWFNSPDRSVATYQALVVNALPPWLLEPARPPSPTRSRTSPAQRG